MLASSSDYHSAHNETLGTPGPKLTAHAGRGKKASEGHIPQHAATGSGIYNMVPDLRRLSSHRSPPVIVRREDDLDLFQSSSALVAYATTNTMTPSTRDVPQISGASSRPSSLWICKPPPTSLIWSFTLMLSLISLYFCTSGD
jgi:hypothetical protein